MSQGITKLPELPSIGSVSQTFPVAIISHGDHDNESELVGHQRGMWSLRTRLGIESPEHAVVGDTLPHIFQLHYRKYSILIKTKSSSNSYTTFRS